MPRTKKKTVRAKSTTFKDIVAELKRLGKPPKNRDGIACTIHCEADPKELEGKGHKLNWKTGTSRQEEYLHDSIQSKGWAKSIIFCANTERIIDGHRRLKDALNNKYTTVPVDVGWWTEEEGDELLASLDPMSNMASVDGNALGSLTELLLKRNKKSKKSSKTKSRSVNSMLVDIHGHATSISKDKTRSIGIRKSKRSLDAIIKDIKRTKKDKREAGTDHREMFVTELREDIIFPSKGNTLGIPDLLQSKLYKDTGFLPEDTFHRSGGALLDTMYYCHNSRPFDSRNHAKPVGGFLGFHCEDERFENIYEKPSRYVEKLQDEQWTAIVEPDFSTYEHWPFALCLWSVYRARWCCRYWQELGMNIIPLIHRSNDLEADRWMYDSLPNPTPLAQMQLRMGGQTLKSDPDYWNNIGAVLQYCVDNIGLEFILFYGTSSQEKYVLGKLPTGLKYRMVVPFIDRRTRRT